MAAFHIYEPKIASKVELFLEQIKTRFAPDKPLDATKWSNLLSFDIMGDVGFGKDFGGLEAGTEHPAIKGIHDHMALLGIMSTVPWMLNLLSRIPGAAAGYAGFFSWCSNELNTKIQASLPRPASTACANQSRNGTEKRTRKTSCPGSSRRSSKKT